MPTIEERARVGQVIEQAKERVGDDVFIAKVQGHVERRGITDPIEIAMAVEAVARDINAKTEAGAAKGDPPRKLPLPKSHPKGRYLIVSIRKTSSCSTTRWPTSLPAALSQSERAARG